MAERGYPQTWQAVMVRDHSTLPGESMRTVFINGHVSVAPAHSSQQCNEAVSGVTHDWHIVANFLRWKSHHYRVVLRTGGTVFVTECKEILSIPGSLHFLSHYMFGLLMLYCLWDKDYIPFYFLSSFSEIRLRLCLQRSVSEMSGENPCSWYFRRGAFNQ